MVSERVREGYGVMGMKRDQDADREQLLSALLIEVVHHRECSGQTTQLRDLHGLLDVPQPVALRLAYRLEQEGSVLIENNLSDTFASLVRLAPRASHAIERVRKGWRRPGS